MASYSNATADFHYRIGWLWAYCAVLLLSALSSALAAWRLMRKHRQSISQSSLQFVIWHFLVATSLHAWIALVLYVVLIVHLRDHDKLQQEQQLQHQQRLNWSSWTGSSSGHDELDGINIVVVQDHDDDGPEAAYISKLLHANSIIRYKFLLWMLLLENVAILVSAFWLFVTTRELFRLARATLDRGVEKEKRMIQNYWRTWLVLCGLLLASAILVTFGGSKDLNRSYRFLVFGAFVIGMVVMAYGGVALLVLKCKGRKVEHVHGKFIKSPLYRRLKSLLIVCLVFTLPYWVLELVLLVLPFDRVDDIPDYLMGICTTLFYSFGMAQAVIMGANQVCCFRLIAPLVPQHIRDTPEWVHLSDLNGAVHAELDQVVDPPTQNVVFVNTDIECSSALWAKADKEVMNAAQTLHDDLLRKLLTQHRGYEITTCGDSFQLAFGSVQDALEFCLDVQLQLIKVDWPSGLDGAVDCSKTERAVSFGRRQVLFKGLRVRMGVHDAHNEEGELVIQTHPITGKTVYIGASEVIAREVSNVGFGGQIIMSQRVMKWLHNNAESMSIPSLVVLHGIHTIPCLETTLQLYQVIPKQLEGRLRSFLKRRHSMSENLPGSSKCDLSDQEQFTKRNEARKSMYTVEFSPGISEFYEMV